MDGDFFNGDVSSSFSRREFTGAMDRVYSMKNI
jgi:hypothetical protein